MPSVSKKHDPIGPWGNYVEAHTTRNGELRGSGEKAQIYNAAKAKWTKAFDVEEDYGGPYKSMDELAANRRWQSDMRDIYGDKEFLQRFHRHIPDALKKQLQGKTRSKSPTRKNSTKSKVKTRRCSRR